VGLRPLPTLDEARLRRAGEGPSLLLGVGARRKGKGLLYPVDEVALKHRAGVETETKDAREAYAGLADDRPAPFPAEFPG
jgi:hypothetical protein